MSEAASILLEALQRKWSQLSQRPRLVNPFQYIISGNQTYDVGETVPEVVGGTALGALGGAAIGALTGDRRKRIGHAFFGAMLGMPLGALAGMTYAGNVVKEAGDAVVWEKEPMWKRPISATLGRTLSPLYAAMLGSTAPLMRSPTTEELESYLSGYKDTKGYRNFPLEVYPGGTHPLHNLVRTWKNPNIGIAGKILGTLQGPGTDLLAASARMDHYNPFAHTATVYTNLPEVASHEAGHAQYFGESDSPTLESIARNPLLGPLSLPLVMRQELSASANGIKLIRKLRMKRALKVEIERRANRILSGGGASYLSQAMGAVPMVSVPMAWAGQAIGAATQPFSRYVDSMDSTEKKGEHMRNAMLQGFVDKCAGMGISPDIMLKYASGLEELAQHAEGLAKANPEIAGAGAGALLGGAAGAVAGGKNRARNAFLGMLGGGAVGAGVGAGMDPRVQSHMSTLLAKLKAGKGGGKTSGNGSKSNTPDPDRKNLSEPTKEPRTGDVKKD